ncbi:MAG: lytic transglycosylase domain-containing protein [Blastocatellia bacterium]|nr:lytic transglycosylase domain-containing protein [Blastocatellia bacterium]
MSFQVFVRLFLAGLVMWSGSTVTLAGEGPRGWSQADLEAIVVRSALAEGLDPLLVAALIRQESGFNPLALSPAGARGIMQFMPATARRYGLSTAPLDERLQPEKAIPAGCRYLKDLLVMFNGDVALALAGYNAGENRVVRAGYQVPQIRETVGYVQNITRMYAAARQGRLPAMTGVPPGSLGQPLTALSVQPAGSAVPSGPAPQVLQLQMSLAKSSIVFQADDESETP